MITTIGAQIAGSRISGALVFYQNSTDYNSVKGGDRIDWSAFNCTDVPIKIKVSVTGNGISKTETYSLSSSLVNGTGYLSVENAPTPITYYIQGELSGYSDYDENYDEMIAFIQYVYENLDY